MAAGTIATRPMFGGRYTTRERAQDRAPVQRWASAPRCWAATPEIYFAKAIDNSRLVKVDDPARRREMRMFLVALSALFVLVTLYAWQHFSAIEYGYHIEQLTAQRDALIEANRALRLEEASLRSPERIDALARQMGLQAPQAGQLIRLEPSGQESGGPVMARSNLSAMPAVSVVSAIP